MKSLPLLVLAALALSACGDPTAEQAASDARERPTRADQMMAFDFAPGSARLDPSQENRVLALVAESLAAPPVSLNPLVRART